jgi:hypothetical protein
MAEVTAKFEAAKANRDAAHLRLIDASKQAEYARQVGDNDTLRKANAEIVAAQQDIMKSTMTLASNMYSGQAALQAAQINADSRELVGGTKGNLKDPNYVANMISDNVTNQMKDMIQVPQIGMSLKNLTDYSALRDRLMEAEVEKFRARGADVSMVSKPSSTSVPPEVQAALSKYGVK